MGFSQGELVGIVVGAVVGVIFAMVMLRMIEAQLRKIDGAEAQQQAFERLSRLRLIMLVGEPVFGAFIGYQLVQIFG